MIIFFIIVEPNNLQEVCTDAKIILNCTSYHYNVLSSKLFYFRFDYDDEQGKTLWNLDARAVARYTFKGDNTLMTTTISFDFITSDLRIFCGGGGVQNGSFSETSLFISGVNDSESKLLLIMIAKLSVLNNVHIVELNIFPTEK